MNLTFTYLLRTAITAPPAGLYYLVQKCREQLYSAGFIKPEKADIPVISIGNIAMGGSGKTPFVICLSAILTSMGFRPAVVSRGYKGSYDSDFLLVSDGKGHGPLCDPAQCGDEPYMIALRLPEIGVIVSRKRIIGCKEAANSLGANVVVLDDGFQHMQLYRDLDIVMINGNEDLMFPMGSLRAPISALAKGDVFITKRAWKISRESLLRNISGKPNFEIDIYPEALITGPSREDLEDPEILKGKPVTLVSGIANPARFKETAEKLGWRVTEHKAFPDHYNWSELELLDLIRSSKSERVVFTEKDWVKLPNTVKKAPSTAALRIVLKIKDEAEFKDLIRSCLNKVRK